MPEPAPSWRDLRGLIPDLRSHDDEERERIRQAQAQAWDEGAEAGSTHGIAYQAGDNTSLPLPPERNPYRSTDA